MMYDSCRSPSSLKKGKEKRESDTTFLEKKGEGRERFLEKKKGKAVK